VCKLPRCVRYGLRFGPLSTHEPRGQILPGDGLVEHAAERWTVDCKGLYPKADDPAGKPIHDDQNPVTPQQDRFRPEQVQVRETMDVSEVRGGSPYGAGTIADPDGSRLPSAKELTMARFQGKHVAGIAAKLKAN